GQTVATFGRLDFAFNNAGIVQMLTPLPDQTEETYDQIMDINVKGVWLSLKHEIPAMLKTGGGAIVNNSSIAGLIAVAMTPIYIASHSRGHRTDQIRRARIRATEHSRECRRARHDRDAHVL